MGLWISFCLLRDFKGVAVHANAGRVLHDATLPAWVRARDVFAGEDAVKAAGEKYLPRLDSQSPEEYAVYVARAAFIGAAARTLEEYLDLVFRRSPVTSLPCPERLIAFVNDCDGGGTSFVRYPTSRPGPSTREICYGSNLVTYRVPAGVRWVGIQALCVANSRDVPDATAARDKRWLGLGSSSGSQVCAANVVGWPSCWPGGSRFESSSTVS